MNAINSSSTANVLAIPLTVLIVLAILLGLCYLLLSVLAWRRNVTAMMFTSLAPPSTAPQGLLINRSVSTPTSTPAWQRCALVATALAHAALLYTLIWHGGDGLQLGYAQALSLIACIGVWLFIVESHWVDIDGLRPVALVLPAVAVILGAFLPAATALRLDALGAAHVILGIAAHGVALLATGHGMLLLALDKVLKGAFMGAKNNRFALSDVTLSDFARADPPASTQSLDALRLEHTWAQTLSHHCPPLVVLERLLIRLSLWTAGLLSLTMGLGLSNGHVRFDHKTVLTTLSLALWLAVPWGYRQRGWRGARLYWVVVLATTMLLLAYIGSRFVLQAILHR